MTGPGGGDSDGGGTGPGRNHVATFPWPDPPGGPDPRPTGPPPPSQFDDDPSCRACGGYFTSQHPHQARGLHAACYLKAWHRFEIDKYPPTRRVKQPRRPAAVGECPDCSVQLKMLVTSALRGWSYVRRCPHEVAA